MELLVLHLFFYMVTIRSYNSSESLIHSLRSKENRLMATNLPERQWIMLNHKAYWDAQFSKHHYIWGETPSKSAEVALALFRKHKANKILIPGSGYGRNSKLFSTSGFDVTGIEISEEASILAREYDPATKVYTGSFLDDHFVQDSYEGIYCFNVLQLFLQADRISFIDISAKKLNPQGVMFFTGISDQDESFGQGQEIEENTFAVKPDKFLHFFTLDDLKEHFTGFKILEVGSVEDQVTHTLYGVKRYQIRYIFVCR
jgi:2-polyprenyl-3-methyl-5-hydroxy-6-metoxy-1,4-benzoquinol methylase